MIKFENVTVVFNGQAVLRQVNLEVRAGEFVSLIGESGVGKTTLLRLVYFDLFPSAGKVIVGEYDSTTVRRRDIPTLRQTLGIVFQDYKLLEDRSVYENVAFALEVTGKGREETQKRTLRVLADVGLSHKRSNMPHELSGGEQQRVVIARALANEPLVILADEPTGNLDPQTSSEILQILKSINSRGTAILLATHNLELVRRSESRILQISDGIVSQVQTV
jgi:cell division transport system ATP-binding protein